MHIPCALGLVSPALCAVLFSTGCSRSEAGSTPGPVASAASLTPVAVAKAATEPLARDVVLTGEFRPYQSIELHAKVAGYLKQITVDVGDRVQAGQLIATI